MKNFPRNKVKKSRKLWNLRYRLYALLVIFTISPLTFYAADKNIPENVTSLSYDIVDQNVLASKLRKKQAEKIAQNDSNPNSSKTKDGETVLYDKDGRIITEQLRKAGIDMGFISSKPFVDLGAPVVVIDEEDEEKIKNKEEEARQEKIKDNSLNNLIPASDDPAAFKNILIYDKYKIRTPIIYTTFEDLFTQKEDGTFDFSSPTNTDDVNSPVQKKLEEGIVHLAYTPQPGEIGNSYIVGHSSNYSWIDSPYNKIFAPINEKSQVGETFIIYDRYGRELKFQVFEVLKIRDDETSIAYQNYPDRRVVTLQTSILGTRNGRIEATHRWLTRGELIVE